MCFPPFCVFSVTLALKTCRCCYPRKNQRWLVNPTEQALSPSSTKLNKKRRPTTRTSVSRQDDGISDTCGSDEAAGRETGSEMCDEKPKWADWRSVRSLTTCNVNQSGSKPEHVGLQLIWNNKLNFKKIWRTIMSESFWMRCLAFHHRYKWSKELRPTTNRLVIDAKRSNLSDSSSLNVNIVWSFSWGQNETFENTYRQFSPS